MPHARTTRAALLLSIPWLAGLGAAETRPAFAETPSSVSASAQQARPVIMRSKPKVHEITLEVELYAGASTIPNFAGDNTVDLRPAYSIPQLSIGVPVLTRTTWCDTDFSTLAWKVENDGYDITRKDEKVFSQAKPGIEAMLRFDIAPRTNFFNQLRVIARYRVQRWEVAVDESAAARVTWPRAWPAWTARFLGEELGIRPEDPVIKALAESSTKGGARSVTPFVAARNAIGAIMREWRSMTGDTSEFGPDGRLRGIRFTNDAVSGLSVGRGTSVELVTTCVAALRALGIPSRIVYGLETHENRSGREATRFRYIGEFFLPDVGWIPFDPMELRGQGAATKPSSAPVKGFANVTGLEKVLPLSFTPVPEGLSKADRYAVWGWQLSRGGSVDENRAFSRMRFEESSRGLGEVKSMPAPVNDVAE